MKSIFLLLIFSIFLTNCGGYLPSPPSNWSANPSEMHVWDPPDKQKIEIRRKNQEYLDNLTGEIERLFINQASLSQEELKLDEDFMFDANEAMTEPESDSAKVLNAQVDKVVQSRVGQMVKHERHQQQSGFVFPQQTPRSFKSRRRLCDFKFNYYRSNPPEI